MEVFNLAGVQYDGQKQDLLFQSGLLASVSEAKADAFSSGILAGTPFVLFMRI